MQAVIPLSPTNTIEEVRASKLEKLERSQTAASIAALTKEWVTQESPKMPYEDRTHPHENVIQARTIQWIKDFNVLDDLDLTDEDKEKVLKKIEASGFGNFIGRCHPDGNLDLVTDVAIFATWLFLYDDRVETKNKVEVRSLHYRTLSILKGGDVNESDDNLTKGFHHVAARIARNAPSWEWRARFIKDVELYCNSTLFEVDNRMANRIPTLEDYNRERPLFSGDYIMFDLIEYVEQITIPKEIFESEFFTKLRRNAAEGVNGENDTLSSFKEFMEKDVHNIIFVLKQKHNCSYAESFARSKGIFETTMEKFKKYQRKAAEMSRGVQIYAKGIFYWLSGHHFWAKNSARYCDYFE